MGKFLTVYQLNYFKHVLHLIISIFALYILNVLFPGGVSTPRTI